MTFYVKDGEMWNPFKSRAVEDYGKYLPDEEAVLEEESHYIWARSKPKAKQRCEEIASEYDGIDPEVESIGPSEFDCRFGVWRKSK
ncbi:MAG: hypothetical protein AAF821_27310 [Cyanobacteria bacterium P01_D01_bin.156]